MGLLHSALDRVRPSLLDFLLSDTIEPAAVVIVVGPLPGYGLFCKVWCARAKHTTYKKDS